MLHFSATCKQIAHAAFSRRLSERLWLFVLVFLAQLRVLFTYLPYQVEIPAEEVQPLLLEQLLRIGGWASLLTLLFALSRPKWLTRTLGVLFSGIVLMLTAYELYLLALYHITYTIGLAQIMLSTSWRESREFLDIITAGQALDVCRQLLPAITGAWVIRLLTKRSSSVLAFGSSLVLTLLTLFGPVGHLYSDLRVCHHHSNFTGVQYSGIDRAIYNTLSAHKSIKYIAAEQDKIRNSQHQLNGLSLTPISQKPLTVVLILGETARRSSMHCYGYPLQNTPYADSLIQDRKSVV